MYIAFKWLFGLTVVMWIAMCCIDVIVNSNVHIKREGFNQNQMLNQALASNTTPLVRDVELRRDIYYKKMDKAHGAAYLPCVMFMAGALMVSLYNRKSEIVLYTKRKFIEINANAIMERTHEHINLILLRLHELSLQFSKILWVFVYTEAFRLRQKLRALLVWKEPQKPRINIMLLKKLQEIGEERKNLGQLLISAIHENKNIRMQYELENMAKNKLVKHIENTQKVIKENRSRYVSFQQLYLVTHQENSFLKSRIKKLMKEKEEAEKNLLELMNEVYKSKNNQLKAFCSRFIVRTTDNLLNSDMGVEIQKFLDKSQSPAAATDSNWQLTESLDVKASSTSWPPCANPRFAEIVQDDILVPLVTDAPKLKGLPGEYVWTVKDKDGLIEKLYEYDYESDLDDGDTIRRIRQYSVYYDKDCLLDFKNSRSILNESRPRSQRLKTHFSGVDYPTTAQGFLTGSEAFQKFMQKNRNMLTSTKPRPCLPRPPLLSA
uniref:Uncharacterized protein n=1 Tax=Heliothis virescens TaxID=7102 RepID=A0A2A4JGP4_HELVI